MGAVALTINWADESDQIEEGFGGVAVEDQEAIAPAWVGSCPLAIICIDSRKRIAIWNPAATDLFGYSEDEAIGQPLTLIIPSSMMSEAEHDRKIDTFSASPKVSSVFGGNDSKSDSKSGFRILPAQRKDASTFSCRISIFKLSNDAQPWYGSLSQDVTLQENLIKKQESAIAQLNATKQKLRALTKVQSEKIARTADENLRLMKAQASIGLAERRQSMQRNILYTILFCMVTVFVGQLLFENTSEARVSQSATQQANVILQILGSSLVAGVAFLFGANSEEGRSRSSKTEVNQNVSPIAYPEDLDEIDDDDWENL